MYALNVWAGGGSIPYLGVTKIVIKTKHAKFVYIHLKKNVNCSRRELKLLNIIVSAAVVLTSSNTLFCRNNSVNDNNIAFDRTWHCAWYTQDIHISYTVQHEATMHIHVLRVSCIYIYAYVSSCVCIFLVCDATIHVHIYAAHVYATYITAVDMC